MPRTPSGVAPARRRKPWRRLAVPALILAALLLTWVLSTRDTTPSASLATTVRDDLVVVTGAHFPAYSTVDVSAQLAEGSGSALVPTADDGGFVVAFRPPDGVTGSVDVSASSGQIRVQAAADIRTAAPAGPDDEEVHVGSAIVVPTTGAPLISPESPESGLPRYEVPPDISRDCTVDVTDTLNDWLGTVPDGSQIHFARQACYRVEGSLTLDNRNNLVIDGGGSTFRAQAQVPTPETNRAQWHLNYGTGITLRNMSLVGVNPEARFDRSNEYDHNIFIRGSYSVTIANVHGRNTYGDFITIAHGIDGTSIPGDITIRNVSADTVGRMGISCVACSGVTVEDSVFNNIGYHVFDLEVEGDERPARGVRYTNNTIGRHGYAFFSVGTPYQTYGNDVSDIHIAGNTMTQPGSTADECLSAISFAYNKTLARNVVIEDNSLISRTDAILVKLASDVAIRNNRAVLVQPSCGSPVGVRTSSTEGIDLRGNEFAGYEQLRADG